MYILLAGFLVLFCIVLMWFIIHLNYIAAICLHTYNDIFISITYLYVLAYFVLEFPIQFCMLSSYSQKIERNKNVLILLAVYTGRATT